jgi:hypothetical protein
MEWRETSRKEAGMLGDQCPPLLLQTRSRFSGRRTSGSRPSAARCCQALSASPRPGRPTAPYPIANGRMRLIASWGDSLEIRASCSLCSPTVFRMALLK